MIFGSAQASVAALAILSGACAQCGSGPTPDPCTPWYAQPLTLEVGTGDSSSSSFQPMPPGGTLPLHPGPDGGYWFYVDVRTTGFCPRARVRFERWIRETASGPFIRYQAEAFRMVDDGTGRLVLPFAQFTFLCPSLASGVPMDARPLDMEVRMTEIASLPNGDGGPVDAGAGRTIDTHVTIVPTCPTGDVVCANSSLQGCAAPP